MNVSESLELLHRGVTVGSLIEDQSDISKLELSLPEKAATHEVNCAHEAEDLDLRRIRMTRHLEAVKELEECIHRGDFKFKILFKDLFLCLVIHILIFDYSQN